MAVANSQAIELFRALPAKTRAKVGYGDLEIMVGAVGVKDRIHDFYVRVSAEERALRMYKRKAGYCSAGIPSCMAFLGKDAQYFSCAPCRKYMREMAARDNKRPAVLTEYGKIRKAERELERAERERAK